MCIILKRVVLSSFSWLRIHFLGQADLELAILQPQLLQYWVIGVFQPCVVLSTFLLMFMSTYVYTVLCRCEECGSVRSKLTHNKAIRADVRGPPLVWVLI